MHSQLPLPGSPDAATHGPTAEGSEPALVAPLLPPPQRRALAGGEKSPQSSRAPVFPPGAAAAAAAAAVISCFAVSSHARLAILKYFRVPWLSTCSKKRVSLSSSQFVPHDFQVASCLMMF